MALVTAATRGINLLYPEQLNGRRHLWKLSNVHINRSHFPRGFGDSESGSGTEKNTSILFETGTVLHAFFNAKQPFI